MPINRQDNKMMLEVLATTSINYETEKNSITFRFNDFKDEAKDRFVRALLADTSIRSIRGTKESDAREILEIANPLLITGGWPAGGWSRSTIYRRGEQAISRIIYYILYRQTNEAKFRYIQRTIMTPPNLAWLDGRPSRPRSNGKNLCPKSARTVKLKSKI